MISSQHSKKIKDVFMKVEQEKVRVISFLLTISSKF